MKQKLDLIPQQITHLYRLVSMANSNGWVYIETRKEMYGLKEAGKLANKLLTILFGFIHASLHQAYGKKWRSICFVLIINNFGKKYKLLQQADHLIDML